MKHLPIRTGEQYEEVARRMEQLQDAEADSEEADELKLLTKLIAEYEKRKLIAAHFGLD